MILKENFAMNVLLSYLLYLEWESLHLVMFVFIEYH